VAGNFSAMRAQGFTLPWNDLLIATIALEKDAAVFANDRHFETMAAHLGLRLYRPGYNGTFNPDH
jgi:predicted nucleic acid-binding protein